MNNDNWPFIIIRCFGTGLENKNFIRSIFDAQRKHPDLVEEIWFGGNQLDIWEINSKLAQESIIFRDECKALGIDFSFQQGITLNHSPDGQKREHLFSEDAWAVSSSGERCWGLFCANSEEARKYTQDTAEKFLTALQPDSYWLDDDLRMYKKGIPEAVCFCERCIKKFNQKYGYDLTREQLTDALFGPVPSPGIRREWTIFNGESLGGFAAVFRNAVSRVLPGCRLGIQTVHSTWLYDGPDYRPLIEALSGPEHQAVGVRPGAGFYTENTLRNMLIKALGVGEEAARCKQYGFVGQLCYESENYPHISAQKSPEAQMIECSLALASGMDSLALYWGSDKNSESDGNYAFYFDTLAQYKPYFKTICSAFQNTRLTGGALRHGSNSFAEKQWCERAEEDESFLMNNAMPIVRESSEIEFSILNCQTVKELAADDLDQIFSGAVLIDTSAFKLLVERFPQLQFPAKVRLESANGSSLVAGGETIYECFETDRHALDFNTFIYPRTEDVRLFSSFTCDTAAGGIAAIPTEFGGTVVLIQYLNGMTWSGYRRKAILDALDHAVPGGMSVRLMTDGFALNVLAHKSNKSNSTSGAFLLNLSIGTTPELELAIRNPEFEEYYLYLPKQSPIKLIPILDTAAEKRFIIPPLQGWQPAVISGI